MGKATTVFNEHASHYNGPRRQLIPPFESFYGTAIEAIDLAGPNPRRILDLGAGTGMLSGFVLEAYPESSVTLFDFAPQMLDQARDSLDSSRVDVQVGDMYREIPEGPWDAIVSALAIHHMTDEGKQSVYEMACGQLVSGGVFINAEHVYGPTEKMDAEYRRWHKEKAHEAGITDTDWAAAVERMTHDHLSPLADQLRFLEGAGFTDVDCLFKDHGFAVIFGRRP
ncbi:MAG: class I SAM-dependent methyltransferase [Solirubrobacterales bacterium]